MDITGNRKNPLRNMRTTDGEECGVVGGKKVWNHRQPTCHIRKVDENLTPYKGHG